MSRRRVLQMLVVAFAAICVLMFSGLLWAQGNSESAFERVKEVQERHTEKLMAKEGVVGTAVGLDNDGNPAVLVLLEHGAVPGIPAQLDGVKVNKMVTGRIYALADTTNYARPVPIGVSTGNKESCSAGTIACRVTDGAKVYALSNNHVYALENTASANSEVLQPGLYDTSCLYDSANVIGTLSAYVTISFTSDNTVDAAIAQTTSSQLGTATPPDGYGTPSSSPLQAALKMPVQKRGRTTGLTKGEISGINATVNVSYSSGTARFVNQIVISKPRFSAAGDSGSLIVTQNGNNPVGLLFAGSNTTTIANPIDLVLDAFGVTIDDGTGVTPPENQAPTASFTFTTSGLTAYFTDKSSDSDGTISSWSWNFGDGATSTAQNPSRTYAAGGTYTVSLTVTDDDGATGSTSQSVTVSTNGGGTTMHVNDIQVDKVDLGRGRATAKAFVVIVDNAGFAVSGATVAVTFSGAIKETKSGVTDSNGAVTIQASGSAGNPCRTTGCVDNVTLASYTYASADNVKTCDNSW